MSEHTIGLSRRTFLTGAAALGALSVLAPTTAFAETAAEKQAEADAVRNQLIGNGLSIPYPQRDLHVYHHDADGRPLSELALRGVADDGDLPRSQPPKG